MKVSVALGAASGDFLWDTGASVTTVGYGTAKAFRLLDSSNRPLGAHQTGTITTANNQTVNSFIFKRKRIVVRHGGRSYTITTDIHVMRNGKRLLGVPAIRALRKEGLVVKFA